ncbi:farnesyl pyrophosphate synthase-like isoform X2 [Cebus imitator]|uniref:farnesyl pyrophosphate synthase-like isoform X2 n=1 Tax=Cebus imitator TaxID=2715852 RepID=UPI00189B112F|nr:farnesyl pyrophosphate synthase-like isoform X2 [Cebus imitator]
MPLSRWLRSVGVFLLPAPYWAPRERLLGSLRRPSLVLGYPVLAWHSARCWCQAWTEEPRALCSSLRMNGDQKSDVYVQEKQHFVQHFSQIVRVLTEDEMGHPETGDATARLKEVLEYNVIGGKYHRGLTVLVAFRELVEPRKQDADSLQRALTVGWCVELLAEAEWMQLPQDPGHVLSCVLSLICSHPHIRLSSMPAHLALEVV